MKTCETCEHFQAGEDSGPSLCYRYPPKVLKEEDMRPIVTESDKACGEWQQVREETEPPGSPPCVVCGQVDPCKCSEI